MRRRELITLLGSAAAAWPFAARAQQQDRMRRIGVLMSASENDLEYQAFVAAFREGLQKLGWMEGRNIRFDYRWELRSSERVGNSLRSLTWSRSRLEISSAAR
jgi:putative tryptophan/tyrosine transport system substrate-binding protein